jgi:hypothetical protein
MKSDWEPFIKKTRCLRAIRRADLNDAQHFLLAEIVDLHVELDKEQQAKFDAELRTAENKEIREMVITWEEHLVAREVKGEARGIVTATRNSILRILEQRLKSVPAFVRAQLEAIRSVERLEKIHSQALTVSSADELVFEP